MKFPVADGLRTIELGTPGTMRDWLNELVLDGKKRATAGTTVEYADNEKEFVGERLALVNDNMLRIGTVPVTEVMDTTFAKVPWSFAKAEGEGFASIEEWRASHLRFWNDEGVKVTDEMPVFLIFFKLVDRVSSSLKMY